MINDLDLTERIYEASIVPELWPTLLEQLARKIDAAMGSVFITSPDGSIRWTGTEGANQLIGEYLSLNTPIERIRMEKVAQLTHDSFYTDHDFNDDTIFEHPYYTEFLYPRNYGWVAAATFNLPTGDAAHVGFERRKDRGAFEREYIDDLNLLRPHLGRAAVLSAQLGLERARGMAQALNTVGIPGAVLRSNGTLHVANELFEKLIPQVVIDRRQRICLAEPGADALLADALARLGSRRASQQSRSIPVAASDGRPPIIFHIVPIRGAANDIFSEGLALLIATPVDRSVVPTAEVLQGLFDLTPAEARIARGIAEGKTIEAIAVANGVSRETVRTQLSSVLAKTGMKRQAELVALLAGKLIV